MNNTVKLYYKCHETMIDMLKDRGYNIPDSLNIDYTQFSVMFSKNELKFLISEENQPELYIHYNLSSKNFGKTDLKSVYKNAISQIKNEDHKIYIIIYDKITASIEKDLDTSFKNVEIFTSSFLCINKTKHYTVPKHELLTKEEAEEVFKTYNASKKQMPIILKSDPISKYYNFSIGDLIKITRFNKNTGKSFSYRIVK